MENLKKDLTLLEVNYDNNKATMVFLDRESSSVEEVSFNKEVYDKDKKEFVTNEDKAKRVDEWCEEYFETTFDKLGDCVGKQYDIYVYERFNSMWPVEVIEKFTPAEKGKIINTAIKEIIEDDYFIKIRYEHKGKTYESKFTFGKYVKELNEWFINEKEKIKQYERFEKRFGIPVARKDELIGKEILVEVKTAYGDYGWGDIKTPDWASEWDKEF